MPSCTAESLIAVMQDYYFTLEPSSAPPSVPAATQAVAPAQSKGTSYPYKSQIADELPAVPMNAPMEETKDPLKEPSMICNESLQIPKSFAYSAESSFTKNVNYHSEPQKAAPYNPPAPHNPSSIKFPQPRFSASPDASHSTRRTEHGAPGMFETPKRFKRRPPPQLPPVEQSPSLKAPPISLIPR